VSAVSPVSGSVDSAIAVPASTSGSRVPIAPTSRPDSGATTAVAPAIGSVYRPACSAENPRTSCRYSAFRNRKPLIAANAHTAMTVAPENGTLRKKRRSRSGSVRRGSYATSAATAAAPSMKQPRISADRHPASGPSMIPYVIDANAVSTSSWPTGSIRRGCGARDSGTKRAASTIAASPTGTLIQKMDRQPSVSTRTPPSTGPAAMLRPTTPPQTPMARARSRGSVNVFVMIDIATGLSIDPPTA
jgi:hypothetical protein